MGGAFARALVGTGFHTVIALTRKESSKIPSGVKTSIIDYEHSETIVKALSGIDFLIITLAVSAPTDTHQKLVTAAAEAGVKWVMPNAYGSDITNIKMGEECLYGPQTLANLKQVTDAGMNYVALCCGFWYEWSLALPEPWFGFTIKERKVTFFDDGNTKISTSTWDQCGRAVASLLSLPIEKEGSGAALSDWKDKPLYISLIPGQSAGHA